MAKPTLPAALVTRARRLAAVAEGRHRARAEELLALVLDRQKDAIAAFWDIGQALRELHDPKLYGALGFSSFDAMVSKKLGMAPATARKLTAIAAHFPRSRAITLQQEKAAALLQLAAARGEDVKTLLARPVSVPGRHEPIRATSLSANELKRAARAEHAARAKGKGPASADAEKLAKIATRVEKRLRAAGVEHASATVAMVRRGGREAAELRLVVPLGAIAALKAALPG